MEKLPIKIKELSPIIIDLIEKIQLLDSDLTTKKQKMDYVKEMHNVAGDFRKFFEKALKDVDTNEYTKIYSERVERAFAQFDWDANVSILPFEFQKHSENAKFLISSILKLLGMKGCGILIIETYVKLCIKIADKMIDPEIEDQTSDRTNFTSLLEGIFIMTKMFQKYWHISFLPNQKNSIALCFSQICKTMPFLLKMIEVKNLDIKKFALKMLRQCFNRLLDEIHSDGNFQAKDCGQEFITLMDFCLNKLNSLANDSTDFPSIIQNAENTISSLKPAIDEILYYAMSVSHVTQTEMDCSAIKSSSLKVVKNFKDLSDHMDNVYNIKLNAQSVGESLCCMERQLNTAVLRLVLEVFTGINCPLKNIVNKCRADIRKDNKASDDLNILISDFDSEMDRIMQIGLFAISCTSDLNRILGIRSCLASLESLETELIPSLTTLYINCNAKNKSNFQHLIDFWLNEMTELKMLIDSILDPAGFCDIVLNQIASLMISLKNDLFTDACLNKANSTLVKITRYSRKLIKTLRRSMEDEIRVTDHTEKHLNDFQTAVQECEAAYKLMEKEEVVGKTIERVYKRVEFLMQKLKKLSSHLFELDQNDSDFEDKSFEYSIGLNTETPQKNYYKLCYTTNQSPVKNEDLEKLTPYVNKGILRSKKRNIFYTTPSHVERELKEESETTLSRARNWNKTPISKKRSRCCKPLNLNQELGNTVDLEITSVLENLCQLNATFCKTEWPEEKRGNDSISAKSDKTKDVMCETVFENSIAPNFKSSGCCANRNLEDCEKKREEEKNFEVPSDEWEEKNFLGTRLRNSFLQSLGDLSKNPSLLVAAEGEVNCEFATPDRLNDLKMVEKKIDFLQRQASSILP